MALTVDVRMMIVEAGIVANCVTGNAAGATLSNRIATEAAVAWDKLQTDVVVSFSPFEAGLVLDGLSRSSDNLTGDIGTRVLSAINQLMKDNNVTPLDDGSPLVGEQPIGNDAPASNEQADPTAPDAQDGAVVEGNDSAQVGPDSASDAGSGSAQPAQDGDADANSNSAQNTPDAPSDQPTQTENAGG